MQKRMRTVLAPMITILMLTQSLIPGVWAANEQMVIQHDALKHYEQVVNNDVPGSEGEGDQASENVESVEPIPEEPVVPEPPVEPASEPLSDEPQVPVESVDPVAADEPTPTDEPVEPTAEPETIYVSLENPLISEATFKNATCETAPFLNLQPLRDHWATEKVEISDEWGTVNYHFDLNAAAGTTVFIKVTFWENHEFDGGSSHGWSAGPGEREALLKVVFAPAPTAEDCTTRIALPDPTVTMDETGEADPVVETDHIAAIVGVQSVAVEGDVVAGDDVVVRVVFVYRHALDTTVGSDWQEDANDDAIFTLGIPDEVTADEDVPEEDALEDEGTPDSQVAEGATKVALPAPEVVINEQTGEVTDVNTDVIASVDGVEAVIVEEASPVGDFQIASRGASDNGELLVRVSFAEGSEFDEKGSDAGWVSEEDGSAVFALTLAGGVKPAAINPDSSGITSAVVDPTILADVMDPVRIEMDWIAVGAPTLATGDSFTFSIENYDLLGIGEITVDDPIFLEGCGVGGAQCGYVIIDASGNGTVILNENVNGAQSASGNFWMQTSPAWAEDLQEDEDREVDLDVISNETTYRISVTIPAAAVVPTPTPEPSPEPGENPYKSGWFKDRDQGRTKPDGAITWEMRVPTGPSAGATLTDTITADAGWEFDCNSVQPINNIGGDVEIDVQCTPLSITVTVGPYMQSNSDNTPGIRVQANITDPANAEDPLDGSLTFENVVTSTNLNWDGEEFGSGEAGDDITQHGPGPGAGDEANPRKSGRFTNNTDQGRENPVGAIEWTVRAPAGPADGVRLVDEAEDGWEFVCDPTLFSGGNWTGGHAASSELIICTPDRVEVEFGAYREFNAGQTPGFTILATRTAEQPENERTVLTFENTVTSYLTPWGGGDEIEGSAPARITQTMPPVPVTDGSKSGRFTRRDNGQYNPNAALEWTISFPPGPNGGVIMVDTSATNDEGVQTWAFDCSTVSHVSGPAAADTDIDCDSGQLTIEYPDGYGSGQQPVYTVRVNLLVPFEEGQVFTNEASFVVTDYVNDPDWGEDGTGGGDASGQITQVRSQGGTGSIGEFSVSVGDYVWFDANRDGLQTDGEPGIGGVAVDLYGETALGSGEYVLIDSTTTNDEGYYWFVDLESDRNYYLQFTEPTELSDGTPLGGWTTQGDGSAQGSEGPWVEDDSNVDESGRVYFTAPTMGANQPGAGATDNPTLDAGVVLPLVSIGDYVWFDYDRDGVQGTHEMEEPVAGVTVTITGPDDFEATTTTDENGNYFFQDLEPSTTYSVVFEMPEGYDGWTIQEAGDYDGLDSNVNALGETSVTTPSSGNNLAAPGQADDPTIDAGLVRLVSIGDFVFIDENLDGVQDAGDTPLGGVSVALTDANGNVRTTTTDEDGYYYFDNLQPGEPYTLVFEKPGGFEWTTQDAGDDDLIDSDVDAAGIIAFTAPLFGANLTGPDQTDNPTLDAGVVRLVSIGDYVWFDYDRDGIQGSHELEEPVAHVTVTLYDADGTEVGTTTTDENGFYSFNNLLPDTDYYLIFEQPEYFDGWTLQDQGEDDAVDSDVDPTTGRADFTSPATGSNSLTAPEDPTLDAGLVVSHVSIGDFVWYDTNLDGIQDSDEDPAAGIAVTLYDAEGNIVGETLTDENGYYWFTDLTPLATYTLEFDAPENYTWTLQDQGEDDGADSDVDRVTGRVSFTADEFGYNLPFGEDNGALVTDNPTLDAGLVPLVSIGDYVWFDYDRDGVQGTHELEEPVAGVTVTLFDAEGTVIGTTTTDENGFYSFSNLYPGIEYSLEFEQPERFNGWTLQDAGENDAVDSDVDAEGRVTFTSPTSGENSLETPDDPTLDAGLIITRVSVGDYVWWDEDRDGVQDEGEEPVSGVVVSIYDSEGEVVETTITDENGYYFFDDLEPLGEYTIVFEKPDGFAGWTSPFEGDEQNDSNVDETGTYSFTAPEFGRNLTAPNETDDPTIDAGLIRLVSIGDYVWYDADRDGMQGEGEVPVAGVVVTLFDSEGEVVGTTTTDENGYYYFQDLLPETEYTLVFEQPGDYTGWTQQDAGDSDAIDSDVNADGVITFVSPATGNNLIGPNETDNPTLDAGLVRLISIGDYVWYDANRDGVQDADEAPVAGVVVTLFDSEGEVVGTTTTDEIGYYYFQNLYPDSEYTLEFERPADYTAWTTLNAGGDDAIDSDVNVNGRVTFTTPGTGSNLTGPGEADDPTLDAGLVRLVSIGDYVWYDANRNGIHDADEVPVAGVVVTLFDSEGEVVGTTTTDENGYYYFQNLYPDSEYTLEFERPADYTAWTTQNARGNDAIDSDVNVNGHVMFTTPGTGTNLAGPDQADDPTLDAGLVRLVSVGDYVWYDTNKNGIQDPDENPAPGIVVHLYEGERLVGTATTDESGYYYFQDLYPDTEYTLVFEKPDGYDWTTPGAGDDEARDSNADILGIVRFTTPSTGSNLIGEDLTDLPTLDAGLVEIDPEEPDATPVPDKKPEPVKELPSTGSGSESAGLGILLTSMAGLMLAAVALRLNAFKRS